MVWPTFIPQPSVLSRCSTICSINGCALILKDVKSEGRGPGSSEGDGGYKDGVLAWMKVIITAHSEPKADSIYYSI
jgi:hypothetical protein